MCILADPTMKKPRKKYCYKVLQQQGDGSYVTPYENQDVQLRKWNTLPQEPVGGMVLPVPYSGVERNWAGVYQGLWSVCLTLKGAMGVAASASGWAGDGKLVIFKVEVRDITRWGVWGDDRTVREALVRAWRTVKQITLK